MILAISDKIFEKKSVYYNGLVNYNSLSADGIKNYHLIIKFKNKLKEEILGVLFRVSIFFYIYYDIIGIGIF